MSSVQLKQKNYESEEVRPCLKQTRSLDSEFRYCEIEGLGREEGVTRRDPSTVLRIKGVYYVWYTRRKTKTKIREGLSRLSEQDWDTPVTDWDLAEIWYATSNDGFSWQEQGCAVERGSLDAFDGRTICTPDVLGFDGKYYLYYQAVKFPKMKRSGNSIGMAWAESPDGPWTRLEHPVLTPGSAGRWEQGGDNDSELVEEFGDWDSHKIHDPFVLVKDGKVWLYYKGQPMGWPMKNCGAIGWGVAVADRPEGPFIKSPLNPITNSGHETCLFPWHGGIASINAHDGPEKDTLQFAEDGLNFKPVASVVLPPAAAGAFNQDKCANTGDGKGFSWGLCHLAQEETKEENSFIIRFECNLKRGEKIRALDRQCLGFNETVLMSPDLVASQDMLDWHQSEEGKEVDAWDSLKDISDQNPKLANINEPDNDAVANPTHPMSLATQRNHEIYGPFKDEQSEFFSAFKYQSLTGFSNSVVRSQPSKVIFHQGHYYVWYRRDSIDGSSIYYATSNDGLHWNEKPTSGFKAINNSGSPDILQWGDGFYLYVESQFTSEDETQFHILKSESPDGPWNFCSSLPDFENARSPFVMLRDEQVWLYFCNGNNEWSLGIAENPTADYEVTKTNLASGKDCCFYPYRDGIAAIVPYTGQDKNTIQFSTDGVSFSNRGKISAPPVSPGPYINDAFSNCQGSGITWGLCHVESLNENNERYSKLIRFECNLSAEVDRPGFFRMWNFRYPESAYLGGEFLLTHEQMVEARNLSQYDEDSEIFYVDQGK